MRTSRILPALIVASWVGVTEAKTLPHEITTLQSDAHQRVVALIDIPPYNPQDSIDTPINPFPFNSVWEGSILTPEIIAMLQDPYIRTRAGQNILDTASEALKEGDTSKLHDTLREYNTFLSQYKNPHPLISKEGIDANLFSATGKFQASLSPYFPGNIQDIFWKSAREVIAEKMLLEGQEGNLWNLLAQADISLTDTLTSNVVGKWINTDTDISINGGNTAISQVLSDLEVSNFIVINLSNGEKIAVFSVNACNGNFGITFIPWNPEDAGSVIPAREATANISSNYDPNPSNGWGGRLRGGNLPVITPIDPINPIIPSPIPTTAGIINSATGIWILSGMGLLFSRRKRKEKWSK